jgi:hypothetical protein
LGEPAGVGTPEVVELEVLVELFRCCVCGPLDLTGNQTPSFQALR